MRLALAQMSMAADFENNYRKSIQFIDLADEHKADLIVFPKLQLTPYFPQYRKGDVGGVLNHIPEEFAVTLRDQKIRTMAERAQKYGFYVSPNLYIKEIDSHHCFDMSLWLTPRGKIEGKSKPVYIADQSDFHERDYFSTSKEGFRVYPSSFGKVGIVVGFDRHFSDSIAACAALGAMLVVLPVANVDTEPLEMYEQEMRVAAFQNGVFVAMCNRVGSEGNMIFAGRSVVVDPSGNIVVRADDSQQFLICNVDIAEVSRIRKKRDYGKYRSKRGSYIGGTGSTRSALRS